MPQLNNWMVFVSGENFTIRGASIAASQSLKLTEGQFYSRGKFLWMPGVHAAGKIYRSCQLVAAFDDGRMRVASSKDVTGETCLKVWLPDQYSNSSPLVNSRSLPLKCWCHGVATARIEIRRPDTCALKGAGRVPDRRHSVSGFPRLRFRRGRCHSRLA